MATVPTAMLGQLPFTVLRNRLFTSFVSRLDFYERALKVARTSQNCKYLS
jgi:hypothetical protein